MRSFFIIFTALILSMTGQGFAQQALIASSQRLSAVITAAKAVKSCAKYLKTPVLPSPATVMIQNQKTQVSASVEDATVLIADSHKGYSFHGDLDLITSSIGDEKRSFPLFKDKSEFLIQLDIINEFVTDALEAARKTKKPEVINQISCAAEILKQTKIQLQN